MNMFMKLVSLIPIIFFLQGCWDRTELNDLAIITALAFDQAENNEIQLSVQIILPQSERSGGTMGGVSGGGGEHRTVVRSEKGFNIADALSKIQRIVPRKLFWGQCKIFIFSDMIAKKGIKDQLDFLQRHPQLRENAYMFVSKGKASNALESSPPIEPTSAIALRKLNDMKIGVRIKAEQLSEMIKGESKSAVVPLIYILPPIKSSEPDKSTPYVLGSAVFKKDRMVGEISEKATRGLMLINNESEDFTITFTIKEADGLVSLKPVKANVKLIPEIAGEVWKMTIEVRTEGDVILNDTRYNPMNPELLNILNKSFENAVKERIQLTLNEAQHRLKLDIFNFARDFHRKYPKQWNKNKDNWDEMFPKIEVNTEVEAHILRTGHINLPGGISAEEVKEK